MDFYRRVEKACMMVPYGKVASYGQIALLCQKPNNSRQVGYALGHRVLKSDVPAHRIVNSRGELSGRGAFDTFDTQQRRLEEEGILLYEENRVDLKKYGWKNTLEDALELEAIFTKLGI